ncbi:hypothetical protein NDU88_003228 [Pleurodeles waltl]|uniref:Uncharacterized protein n=1 Tax=Pleurodeles waltl TaxID=8319 RepID=A0AAV7T4P5_PLEWA|nr:hypothetical protein NDU88_003228 [Pleurodeles waltl]
MLSSAPSGVQVLLGLVVPPGARRQMERAWESGLEFLRLPGKASHNLANSSFASEAPCHAALGNQLKVPQSRQRGRTRGERCALTWAARCSVSAHSHPPSSNRGPLYIQRSGGRRSEVREATGVILCGRRGYAVGLGFPAGLPCRRRGGRPGVESGNLEGPGGAVQCADSRLKA